MDTDRTLKPEDPSLVACPHCGKRTAVLTPGTEGMSQCVHCTGVIDPKAMLELGVRPSPSERRTALFNVQGLQFGRYQLERQLGQGGMGVVWLAKDVALGRQVALKLLSGASEEDLIRFEREARTVASLSHPNIAPIFEVGQHEGRPFIAMQYIAGQSLDQLLETRRPGAREAALMVRDAARAVHHAHEQGIIHRDLKPHNLMIEERTGSTTGTPQRVYVMDFGLARRTDVASSLSASGQVVGTPAYMSPEQATGGGDLDVRTDVYGLGATLYTLVTGRPPFEGPTPLEIVMKVASSEVLPPRRHNPTLHADIETIVMKAMERDRERRYPTAQELADDLDRFLENEPIRARPASLATRLTRKIRKYPARIAAGGAVVVALVLGAILLTGGFQREAERRELRQRADQARSTGRWTEAATQYEEYVRHFGEDPDVRAALDECRAKEREARDLAERERRRRDLAQRASQAGERLDDAQAHFELAEFDTVETWRIVTSALAMLDSLRGEDPDVAETLLHRARALRLLHRLETARYDIDRAIALAPELRQARIERIRVIFDQLTLQLNVPAPGEREGAMLIDYTRIAGGDLKAIQAGTGSLPPRAQRDLDLIHELKDFMIQHDREGARSRLRERAERERDADFWFWLAVFQSSDGLKADAEASVRAALDLRPSFARAHFMLGVLLAEAGDDEGAIAAYSEAIRLDPYDVYPLINRGVRLERKGEKAGALTDLQRAVELAPDLPTAWRNLSVVALQVGDAALALRAADRAVAVAPRDIKSHEQRARVNQELKRWDDLLSDCDRGLKIYDRQPWLLAMRAFALLHLGRVRDSLAAADQSIREDPRFPRAHYFRAAALERLGDLEGALAAVKTAIDLGGDDADSRVLQAFCLAHLRRLDECLEAANLALQHDPKRTDALALRAEVYRLNDDKESALQDLERILKLDAKNVDAILGRAMILQETGRADEAVEDIDRVIRDHPDNDIARFLKARDLMAHGFFEEAITHIDAVLPKAKTARATLETLRRECVRRLEEK